jgi:hypothetical protein
MSMPSFVTAPDFIGVLTTNLNNVCSPSSESFPDQLIVALTSLLRMLRKFACDIRQSDAQLFRHSLVTRLEGTVRVLDPIVLEWVRAITQEGFTVDQATADSLSKLLLSQALPPNSDVKETPAGVPPYERVRLCASFLHPLGIVYYCDKNSGLGTICCKRVAWGTYRDKFYCNPDDGRTHHTTADLTALYRKAFADNDWGSFSRFDDRGDGFNTPFAPSLSRSLRTELNIEVSFRRLTTTLCILTR